MIRNVYFSVNSVKIQKKKVSGPPWYQELSIYQVSCKNIKIVKLLKFNLFYLGTYLNISSLGL